jgi:catechol 2,3-dioxygenase-like lactoylglutathione lyase family enzyme
MSIKVTLQQLAETLTRYRFAYLLSVGDDARAHVVAVSTTLANDTLLVTDLGRKTRANLAAHSSVTLVWPPANPSDYSLIVDGVGSLRGDELAVAPTRAVLHRPAPPQITMTGGGCESDCVELPVAAVWSREDAPPLAGPREALFVTAGGGFVFDSVHHVQLAMPRGAEAAARAFFGDILGMTEINKPAVLAARGGVWFGAGGVELHLGVEEDFRPARKAHPGIVVDDLDALVEHLAGAGHNVQWDHNFPGFRRAYAHDPFGNRLEFLEPSQ